MLAVVAAATKSVTPSPLKSPSASSEPNEPLRHPVSGVNNLFTVVQGDADVAARGDEHIKIAVTIMVGENDCDRVLARPRVSGHGEVDSGAERAVSVTEQHTECSVPVVRCDEVKSAVTVQVTAGDGQGRDTTCRVLLASREGAISVAAQYADAVAVLARADDVERAVAIDVHDLDATRSIAGWERDGFGERAVSVAEQDAYGVVAGVCGDDVDVAVAVEVGQCGIHGRLPSGEGGGCAKCAVAVAEQHAHGVVAGADRDDVEDAVAVDVGGSYGSCVRADGVVRYVEFGERVHRRSRAKAEHDHQKEQAPARGQTAAWCRRMDFGKITHVTPYNSANDITRKHSRSSTVSTGARVAMRDNGGE